MPKETYIAPLHPMPEFMPGETLTSLVGRTARLKGFSGLREFCTSIGLDHFQVGNGNLSEISKFANLSGLDCATLERAATRNLQSNNSKIGELVVHKNHLSRVWGRYCPDCIREDLAADNGIGRKMFERQIWELSCIRRCPVHGTELKQAMDERPKTRAYDTLPEILAHFKNGNTNSAIIPPSSLELFILNQMNPVVYQYAEYVHSWLQEIAVDVIIALSEAIGFTDQLEIKKGASGWSSLERHQFGSNGFDILRRGPTAFRESLEKRATRKRHEREYRGVGSAEEKLFGHVGEYFVRESHRDAALPVFEAFFTCYGELCPKKPGTKCFGRSIQNRSHHTVSSLAQKVGLSTRIVRRILMACGRIGASSAALSADDVVVEASSSEALCYAAADSLSMIEVRKILGVSRKTQQSVLEALNLTKTPWAHAFEQGHYAIDSVAVQEALQITFADAEKIAKCEAGTDPLHVIATKQSISMGLLLKNLRSKPRVWRGQLPESSGLKDLVIRHADVHQLLSSSEIFLSQPAIGKVTASEQLRVSLQAIVWLHTEKKILAAAELEHQNASSSIRFHGDDFATFAETYVSPGIIKRFPGTIKIEGKRNLIEFGLKTVWDPKKALAHWYRRSEAIASEVLSINAPCIDD